MSTSYGKNLNISIYGGSHDEEIGIIAKGMPKGFYDGYDSEIHEVFVYDMKKK